MCKMFNTEKKLVHVAVKKMKLTGFIQTMRDGYLSAHVLLCKATTKFQ